MVLSSSAWFIISDVDLIGLSGDGYTSSKIVSIVRYNASLSNIGISVRSWFVMFVACDKLPLIIFVMVDICSGDCICMSRSLRTVVSILSGADTSLLSMSNFIIGESS